MGRPFPPGGTPFAKRNGRNRCLWREEALLLHVTQEAINPYLGLRNCLDHWDEISYDLREAPRERPIHAHRLEHDAPVLS